MLILSFFINMSTERAKNITTKTRGETTQIYNIYLKRLMFLFFLKKRNQNKT